MRKAHHAGRFLDLSTLDSRLARYLRSRNETPAAFAARAGVGLKLVLRALRGIEPQLRGAVAIVEATREQPARGGLSVSYTDLIVETETR